MAGSDNESDDASVHSEATIPQQQQNIQPQIITTVSNNNAKFPYLKKDEYEVWAMKMEYWITNNDMNIWKMNTLLFRGNQRQELPCFSLFDARDIWNAVKARFGGNAESKKMRKSMLKQEFSEFRISEAEGLHKGYDRMQKILSQLNQLKAKPEDEDINLKFLRGLLHQLKTLEVDIKGYSTFSLSQSAGPSHSAFVSTTSASKKMSYADSPSYTSSTYTVPSNSKTGSHRSGNVIEDVLQSFVADTEPEQQLAYEDFDQIEKLDLEEMDLKWQMAMLSVRVHKFEQKAGRKIDFDKKESARAKGGNDKQRYSSFKIQKIGKKEEDSKALITVDTLVDWTEHDGQSDGVITPKEFGMIAGCDTEDAIREGAAKIYNLLTGADTKKASTAVNAGEFALMGVTSETELDNHLVQIEKWETSSKNLFKLIDSSMSVRTKVGLGFSNYISKNELGWDDSAFFSVYLHNSKEVEGRPLFNRFAKADSIKVVPPPLSGDYTPLSDHIDLDESQMSYGTKSSTSGDSNSVSNDFVSCDNSDNVSTSDSEAEIESNVGPPIKKPISSGVTYYLHLIKDCNYYETQYPNDFDGVGYPQREPIWDNATRVTQSNQFVPQAVLLRSGKVSIPAARPNQVPAGRPKLVSTGRPKPVSTGKQNRPPPVHAGRRNSSLVTSGWWQSTARPMTHLPSPTSSYFQTYTPYVPQMYYNHMQYGGVRWATAVKPSAGCSWKTHRKGLYWENSYTDAEDEGIFDSGCSRISTHNCDQHPAQNLNLISTASMAALRYRDEHNKVGYLQKPKGSDDYHQILDFLGASHIRSLELGPPAILATIDATPYTITEDSNKFSPQWRFLVHTILHCLSSKSGSWDQFGSPIAVALICLSDRRKFNWSSYIFKGMGLVAQTVQTNIPEPILEPMPETDQPQDHLTAPQDNKLLTLLLQSLSMVKVQTQILLLFHKSRELMMHLSLPPMWMMNLWEVLSMHFHQGPLKLPLQVTLQEKVNSLETELKAHKKLFKDVVGKLVKQVKAMEVKLKIKKRKVVVSDSDKEDGGEQDVDLDALHALANAAVTVDSTKSPGGASSNPAACSYDPTSDVPTTDVPTDVPSGVAPTGPSTVSPGSTTVPTSSSIPAAEPIPARSGTTTATPSSPVKDARKGKGVAVEEPTPTQDKTFKQLEEERLGWEAAQRLQAQELADLEKQRVESLMKDANLARQMSQDFEMTEDQRKRQQEVLASAANYSDAAWDIILARLQANPDLSSIIFGVDFTDDDFAAKMVALVNSRRKELAEQRAQERRDRPMTPAQLRQYMRTYVKNQGPAVYTTGWTMAQVRKLSPKQHQEEFDKIQRAVAFTRGLKRDGSPMTTAFSKKLKTSDVEVDVEAPSHDVPQEVEVEAPSQDVSREIVVSPSRLNLVPTGRILSPGRVK
ncbi:hypothetical protein Tco_1235130 [Tanacetum coccineum]